MKLIYLANIRLPTERAHGIQIMKTCESLSNAGSRVVLVVPTRNNNTNNDPFSFYDIKNNFSIKRLPCPDLVRFGKPGVFIQYIYFSLLSLFYSLRSDADVFYSRDELPIWFLSFFNKKVFWESHTGKWNFLVSSITKRCFGVITISNGIKDFLKDKGIKSEKIFVSPDAVDINKFSLNISAEEAKEKTGLPKDKKIIMYTGHLYGWKGVDTLGQALKNFDDKYLFVFVGGTSKHIEDFKRRYDEFGNLIMVGQVSHEKIPLYLKSADVLVIPNTGREDISRLYTSPMKLFEYMASGVPIVASDLPSIREILDEGSAVFFEPDDSESLTGAIKKVFANSSLSCKLPTKAKDDSKKYSWENRASGIINFISKNVTG